MPVSRLDLALQCAGRGYRVLPLKNAGMDRPKTPLCTGPFLNGCHSATLDEAVIRAAWTAHPLAWVGLATGNGLTVLDFDTDKAGNAARTAEAVRGELQAKARAVGEDVDFTGFNVQTVNGGLHHYFQAADVASGSNLAGIPNFDVRSTAGYVVLYGDSAPPPLPDLPVLSAAVTALFRPRRASPPPPAPAPVAPEVNPGAMPDEVLAYWRAKLHADITAARAAGHGVRHSAILTVFAILARRVKAGCIGLDDVERFHTEVSADPVINASRGSSDETFESKCADTSRAALDAFVRVFESSDPGDGPDHQDNKGGVYCCGISDAASMQLETEKDFAAFLHRKIEADWVVDLTADSLVRWDAAAGIWKREQCKLSKSNAAFLLAEKELHPVLRIQARRLEPAAAARFLKKVESSQGVQAYSTLLHKMLHRVERGAFDAKPGRITDAAGRVLVFDRAAGFSVEPALREDYATKALPHRYDPAAKCPQFERFLSTVMGGDLHRMEAVQLILGYSLAGEPVEQLFFVMQGSGGNGKGTLVRAVSSALGENFVVEANGTSFLSERSGGSATSDLVHWPGKHIVFATELPAGRSLNIDFLKAITGGDGIEVRDLYQSSFKFIPRFVPIFSANHGYEIASNDKAMTRRFRVIPFDVDVPDHQRDPNLGKKLAAESAGILAWMVEGWKKYIATGKPLDALLPDDFRELAREVQEESNPLNPFIAAHTDADPNGRINVQDLWHTYESKWAPKNGREYTTQRAFTVALIKAGWCRKKSHGCAFWVGHTLRAAQPLLARPQSTNNA